MAFWSGLSRLLGAAALATAGVSAVGKSLGLLIGSAAPAADQVTATTDLLFRSSSATRYACKQPTLAAKFRGFS